MSSMPPVVVRMAKGALLFFPLLSFLFWLATPLGLLGALYLTFLLELLPVLALAQLPLVDEEERLPRVPVYLSSAATILTIGLLGLLVGWREVGMGAMGLSPGPWGRTISWALGVFGVGLILVWGFWILRKARGLRESPLVVQLLPKTGGEKALFALLSLSAGVGEEIAYRGYLIPALTLLLGWEWGAALLSSAVFGVLHAYQGWVGILRTGVLGLALGASFILSGTLWPAILAHAILDLVVGLVFGETLVSE